MPIVHVRAGKSCCRSPPMQQQPSKLGHWLRRRKYFAQLSHTAPQDGLIAADGWFPKQPLNICDRLDLCGVGATEKYPVGIRTIMLARKLGPLPRCDSAEMLRLDSHSHV